MDTSDNFIKKAVVPNFHLLAVQARDIRISTLNLIYQAKKGHIGGCFSCADILVAVYYGGLFSLSPKEHSDRFLMSKGHCAAVLYAVLHECGYFDKDTLVSYGENNTLLGAHPDARLAGVDVTSGSLGMGLGIGVGIAFANSLDKRNDYTVVLTGDGECYEGAVWEAAMFGAHRQLGNLIWIIDRNMLCVLDRTEDCNRLEPLAEKIAAFGWEVQEVNGHDFSQLSEALETAHNTKSTRPKAIIAKTVKGKGVSFMENQLAWHHKVPNAEEYEEALNQLRQTNFNGN
jgi:transketolase